MVANLSLSGSGRKGWWGGRLFEAGRLLTFSAFRMGAYSRWALIRSWALIRINTVILFHSLSCVSITAEEEQWDQNFILNRLGIMNDKQTPLIITGFSLVQL